MTWEWVEKAVDGVAVDALEGAGYPRLVARLLALRGVVDAASAQAYFTPDHRRLAAPGELPGVDAAAEVILRHVDARRRIVVFGDYDCDGVCATAILVTALRALGGSVGAFIPRRIGEGYGMNPASVARMLELNPDVALVVTVDNGINAVREVADLKARGVSVVVTDHHLPTSERSSADAEPRLVLPDAEVVVNPKVASPAPLEGLCGAGVAYFLSKALVDRARAAGDATRAKGIGGALLTMAGLATVTDVMPLSEQNRILVAEALRHFGSWAPTGLKELYARSARTGVTKLTTRDFGFQIGPRINAVGRIEGEFGTAMEAPLELMLLGADRRERARELAQRVDLCSTARKRYEKAMAELAKGQVVPDAAAQVIALESSVPDVHPGVAGIVASRVLEGLDTPVPVCVVVDGRGSARAPAEYNLRDALAESAGFLTHFGGHAAAAGLSVKDGCFDAFAARFREVCAKQAGAVPPERRNRIDVDAVVSAEDLTLELAEQVARMEPFGEGNPEPRFVLRGVRLADVRPLGQDGAHLSLSFRGNVPRAVWWNSGSRVEELRADSARPHDILFAVSVSTYLQPHAELRILDLR